MRVFVILLFSKLLAGFEKSAAFQSLGLAFSPDQPSSMCSRRSFKGNLLDKVSGDDGEDVEEKRIGDDNDDNQERANDLLHRQTQEDPTVRRKRRNGTSYKIVDNRDNLPFVVKVVTPDPYKRLESKKNNPSPEVKRKHQLRSQEKKQLSNKKNTTSNKNNSIPASIISQNSDGSTGSVIGEFALDKSTTSGDVICIGDLNYQVQAARCQYKYVGGKRFVMIRKILEVKEITRAGAELFLQHQFNKDMPKDDIPSIEL